MKEEEIRKKETFDRYLSLVKKDVKHYFKDTASFEKIRCPACSSTSLTNEFEKVGFTYQQCKQCYTLFVNPRPTHEQLIDFYASSPSTTFWINDFFKPVEKIRTTKIFQPRAEWVVNYFGKSMKKWTIGDIGAGFGIFLQELKNYWRDNKYIAIEPSREQCEICEMKGLDFICKAVEDIDNMGSTFDLLTAFELFEHLQNPGRFLDTVYHLLKPGGYFLFTTLNGNGFDIQILWDKSKSVFPPHHLNFFNPNSIGLLIKNHHFKVIDIATPGKLDWNIVENMINKDHVSVERFWNYIANSHDEKMKDDLQTWIRTHNLSSHMRVLCSKPK